MKTLIDLYNENPTEYREWVTKANKECKKLVVVDDYFALEDIEQPIPTYADKRRASYPPIEEQLDMIYHDKENGTNKWFELIKDIKDKYPKDEVKANDGEE